MKPNKNLFFTILILAALSGGAWAQTETSPNAASPKESAASSPAQTAVTATDIQELRDALAAQQRQIQALVQALVQALDGPALSAG